MTKYQFIKRTAKNLLDKLPYCGKLIRERKRMMYPPGHFYSPFPLIEEIKLKEQAIFDAFPRTISGIDLNESEQLALLEEFKKYYQELPFSVNKTEGLRYRFEGEVRGYGYSDAITLYCMIRHLQPQKIIEVGCGKSSCVTFLQYNDAFKIVCFNSFLIKFYEQKIRETMPLFLTIAGSIWIKKI